MTDVASLLTPAADSLAPARSALTGLRLRRIPIAAFPSSDSLLVERREGAALVNFNVFPMSQRDI